MKRILAFLLIACLVCALLPLGGGTHAAGSCFLAINENLQSLTDQPYFSGGTTYVPYWVFTSLGVNYSYSAAASTAFVYSSSVDFFFELGTGSTYDADGNNYSVSAVFRNGTVYLPAQFMCENFGFSCSYIVGNEYGDIFRVKSGAVLSDKEFLSVAAPRMKSLYNEYYGTGGYDPVVTPTVTPSPSPTPDMTNLTVNLCFYGLPEKAVTDVVEHRQFRSCLFLTAQEISENADRVRELAVKGHSIGILCGDTPQEEYEQGAALLYDAARLIPLMIASVSGSEAVCEEFAAEAGLRLFSGSIDARYGESYAAASTVISAIESSRNSVGIALDGGETVKEILPAVLQYLVTSRCNVAPLREAAVN